MVQALLLLMDLRREPGSEEARLMAWLGESGLPFFPVLTKIDKLKPQARAKKLRFWREQLQEEVVPGALSPVSAHLKLGREELWAKVAPLLSEETDVEE